MFYDRIAGDTEKNWQFPMGLLSQNTFLSCRLSILFFKFDKNRKRDFRAPEVQGIQDSNLEPRITRETQFNYIVYSRPNRKFISLRLYK